MGRIQDEAERLRATVSAVTDFIGSWSKRLGRQLLEQIRLTVDRERWAAATDWRARIAAVSWPRAGVGATLVAGAALSLWIGLQPTGLRAHPPRLPTEVEWRATQAAAAAMESDLSPALAAANLSEGSGDRP